jgi:hypothetical protein
MPRRKRFRILAAVAALLLVCAGVASAQVFMVAPGEQGTWCPHGEFVEGDAQCVKTTWPTPSTVTHTVTVAPTTTTTTTPPTEPPPFPNAGSTGVPAGTSLQFVAGDTYNPPAGTVRDGIETNALEITQPNVTIRNSYIRDSVLIEGNGSLTLENVTIGPECKTGSERIGTWFSEAIRGQNYTADKIKVQGHEDGPRAGGANITVKNSFIDICGHPDAHSDGVQDYPSGNNIVFEHNTVDLRNELGQNAAVNINAGDQGSTCLSNNVKVRNNLLMGGAYTMTLCPTTTGWEVTGNRIVQGTGTCPTQPNGSCGAYSGPHSVAHGCKGVWTDNDVVTTDGNYAVTSTVQDNRPC